jgi:hypothetical protein
LGLGLAPPVCHNEHERPKECVTQPIHHQNRLPSQRVLLDKSRRSMTRSSCFFRLEHDHVCKTRRCLQDKTRQDRITQHHKARKHNTRQGKTREHRAQKKKKKDHSILSLLYQVVPSQGRLRKSMVQMRRPHQRKYDLFMSYFLLVISFLFLTGSLFPSFWLILFVLCPNFKPLRTLHSAYLSNSNPNLLSLTLYRPSPNHSPTCLPLLIEFEA